MVHILGSDVGGGLITDSAYPSEAVSRYLSQLQSRSYENVVTETYATHDQLHTWAAEHGLACRLKLPSPQTYRDGVMPLRWYGEDILVGLVFAERDLASDFVVTRRWHRLPIPGATLYLRALWSYNMQELFESSCEAAVSTAQPLDQLAALLRTEFPQLRAMSIGEFKRLASTAAELRLLHWHRWWGLPEGRNG